MLASHPAFDPKNFEWQRLSDPSETDYKIDYSVAILGYDLSVGTCDFLVRFDDAGGHCPRHRHVGTTTSLVLAGEHRVTDLFEDGTSAERVKPAGTYGLSPGDVHPHLERGGDEGAIVFFGNHTQNGLLYEIIDADLKVVAEVSIEMLVRNVEVALASSRPGPAPSTPACHSGSRGANFPGKPRASMTQVGFPPIAEKFDEVVRAGFEGFIFTTQATDTHPSD